MNRREFIITAGGTAGAVAASGAAAAQEGNNSSGGNGSGGGGGGGGSGPIDYGDWFSDVPYWSAGNTQDMTGKSEVTITVGAEGVNNALSFQPAAVHIDEGTTVIWEWTGQGGAHNVEAESNADFASQIVGEQGHTFEWTANTTGIVPYFCNPHRGQGMKGALAIGSDLPRQAAGGSSEPANPEEMGVPIQAHFVGLATILMVLASLIFTFFLLKYGESAHTKGGNN